MTVKKEKISRTMITFGYSKMDKILSTLQSMILTQMNLRDLNTL